MRVYFAADAQADLEKKADLTTTNLMNYTTTDDLNRRLETKADLTTTDLSNYTTTDDLDMRLEAKADLTTTDLINYTTTDDLDRRLEAKADLSTTSLTNYTRTVNLVNDPGLLSKFAFQNNPLSRSYVRSLKMATSDEDAYSKGVSLWGTYINPTTKAFCVRTPVVLPFSSSNFATNILTNGTAPNFSNYTAANMSKCFLRPRTSVNQLNVATASSWCVLFRATAAARKASIYVDQGSALTSNNAESPSSFTSPLDALFTNQSFQNDLATTSVIFFVSYELSSKTLRIQAFNNATYVPYADALTQSNFTFTRASGYFPFSLYADDASVTFYKGFAHTLAGIDLTAEDFANMEKQLA